MGFQYIFLGLLALSGLYALKRPIFALVAFIALLVWENPLVEFYDISATIIQIFGLLMAVIFVISHFLNKRDYPLKVGNFHLWFFIYILFILLKDVHLAFGETDDGRNWASTYLQLLVFTILTPSLISTYQDLRTLMLSIITAISLFGIWFIFVVQGNLSITEADFSSANTYARYIVIAIIFAIYFLHSLDGGPKRTLIIISLVLLGLLLIYTGSRTMLILMAGIVGFLMLRVYQFKLKNIVSIGLLLLIGLLILPGSVIDQLIGSFTGETYEGGAGTTELQSLSNNIRLLFWKEGFNMMNDHGIFFGIGIGQFKILITDYLPFLNVGLDTHNTYMSVLFEQGIIGFLIFLMIIRAALRGYGLPANPLRIFSNSYWPPRTFNLTNAYALALLIILIGSITKHDHYDKLFFMLLSVSAAIFVIRKRAQP